MNEQIKILADTLWRVHPSDIDAMGLKTRTEFYEHELTKFAESIVRECAEIADEGFGSTNFGNGICGAQVLKHFGVE